MEVLLLVAGVCKIWEISNARFNKEMSKNLYAYSTVILQMTLSGVHLKVE